MCVFMLMSKIIKYNNYEILWRHQKKKRTQDAFWQNKPVTKPPSMQTWLLKTALQRVPQKEVRRARCHCIDPKNTTSLVDTPLQKLAIISGRLLQEWELHHFEPQHCKQFCFQLNKVKMRVLWIASFCHLHSDFIFFFPIDFWLTLRTMRWTLVFFLKWNPYFHSNSTYLYDNSSMEWYRYNQTHIL